MSDNDGETEELPQGPVENAWAIKIPEFKKGDMTSHLLEESSFSVLFPKYREKYLKECWPLLTKTLADYGVKADLDLIEGRMTVCTTRKTWDPYIIIKARDIIMLLGRSVPVEQAVKVLQDDVTHEIIKIRNMIHNKDRFVKRRQRLIGANGTTLKALELLTNCYVLVQGGTVAAIGPHKGVLQVLRVVTSTMKNIHPVYLLKALMIKRQLVQDPNLKDEDWSRFIPNFTSKNVQRKKPKVKKAKKPYTPFPPAATERKVDKQMAEGKFFVDQEERKISKKRKPTEEKKKENAEKQKEKRAKAFVAPEEPKYKPVTPQVNSHVDIESLKKKVKNRKSK
ncbi:KRR1 small subunit processome component homolog [Procambarus clarkii]|uniref:KRR1 small subunit processome component homolog n=1 Tax=Procambarus clarkii TaxID=6728 RepID=UPI001E66FE8A|nr:KRR1 small subunit processome component homolog [Procambarus clarkii]XP_045582772.1 KRR1 small subunit processome component homolog [Procambarus clarkii]